MTGRITTALILVGIFAAPAALPEPFSAEHLVRLDRVGAPVISPDGDAVAYAVRTTDMDANKGGFDLWISDIDGAVPRQLTSHKGSETEPAWSRDGQYVYFLSRRSGSSQIWRVPRVGGSAIQVTDFPVDVGTFRLGSEDSLLVFSAEVYLDCENLACTAARDQRQADAQASGMVFDQLFMRHWDHWLTEKRSRLFVVPLDDGTPADSKPRLLSGEVDADVPSRVWGGNEEYTISADGSTVYFAARLRDAREPMSTNFDIYSVPTNGDGPTLNLTESNRALDTRPVLSPDGRKLAYLAMSRPGFESDRRRIMVRDLASGDTDEVAPNWDFSAQSLTFSADGATLYVNAQDTGNLSLWRIDVASGKAKRLVGHGTVSALDVSREALVFARNTLKSPTELFVIDAAGDEPRQITDFSGPQLEGVELGDYEQFSFTGAADDPVYGFVVKPANFEEGKKYPVAFLIHGGPQNSFSNNFHYRWNPQTYAGQGFAAVFIDFHGSIGYGQEFTDSITGDWGDKPLRDLQLGLKAAFDKYNFLDAERVCALGASYGGYMVNWIAGNWPKRFDCLVNHDGLFDLRMMSYTTEELWFVDWEHGGPYYASPGTHEKHNPANYVERWRTPMLVIHGELDYRVPVTQGIATFTALQRRGIESRFLYFPDENHWVLQPANSLQWHEEVNRWLHKFLDDGT